MKPLFKTVIAAAMTVGLLAALLAIGSRRPGPASTGPSAEDAVRELLRSGEAGDVTDYLGWFSGPLRDRIAREVSTRGEAAFADDLRRNASGRKGHAIHSAREEDETAALVVVESAYADRNERQSYRVEKTTEGWRVVEVAEARSVQPPARVGDAAGLPSDGPIPPGGLRVETGEGPEPP